MREIEFREIFRDKCPMCGCKNKIHTELIDQYGKFVGYTLKCCGCGSYREFLLDRDSDKTPHLSYKNGKQTCIQPSGCPHFQTCKLYHKKMIPDKDEYTIPDKPVMKTKVLTILHLNERFL